ncbi:unnamed protein product [Cuscuta campestris]|uniref:Retrotransposon gag domain-containing protein n=1 Tax=Cuscuta campestris TaxID=132261 RepID=A0A484M368_9ASTE|nr:unnamed protein product [Cuscuta campestris]
MSNESQPMFHEELVASNSALKAQGEYLAKEVAKLTKIKLNALQGSDHEDDASTSSTNKAKTNDGSDFKVDVPTFEGKNEPDEFLEWLETVERVFDFKEVSDEKKVKIVALKFRKYASTWWTNTCTKRRRNHKEPVAMWAKMKSLLKKKFLPAEYVHENFAKLQTLKQGSKSVEEYTREFEELLLRCDLQEDDEQTFVRYLFSLNLQIANTVELQSYESLEELTKLALKELYKEDEDFKDTYSKCLIRPYGDFLVKDGYLFRGNQLCVSKSSRDVHFEIRPVISFGLGGATGASIILMITSLKGAELYLGELSYLLGQGNYGYVAGFRIDMLGPKGIITFSHYSINWLNDFRVVGRSPGYINYKKGRDQRDGRPQGKDQYKDRTYEERKPYPFFPPRGPKLMEPEEYTPLTHSVNTVFDYAKHQGLVEYDPSFSPLYALDNSPYCRFHKAANHDTDEFNVLKREIENLIRAGNLSQFVKNRNTWRKDVKSERNFFFNKLLILSQVFTGALFSRLLLVDRLDHQVEAYFRNFNATILTFFSSGTSLKSKTRSTVSSHSRKSSGSFFPSKVGIWVVWWGFGLFLSCKNCWGEGGMNVARAEVEGQGVGRYNKKAVELPQKRKEISLPSDEEEKVPYKQKRVEENLMIYGGNIGGDSAEQKKKWVHLACTGDVSSAPRSSKMVRLGPVLFGPKGAPEIPSPHRDALVVKCEINDVVIHPSYVDNGSSIKSCDIIDVEGLIKVMLTIGDGEHKRTILVEFMVVHLIVSHNLIIG